MRKPTTVLMTADRVGGVWIYATDLARQLALQGVRTVIAVMGTSGRPQEVLPDGVIIEAAPFKLEWMQEPWKDVVRAGEWLLELESRYRPDVIHLNNFVHGALPWSAPCVVVGHSCVCSWFEGVRRTEAPSDWDRYRREVAAGIKAADAVTAPTRAMLASLQKHYGLFRSAGAIYNGRTVQVAEVAKEPFVLTAGRLWDEAKNVRVLDCAARELSWPVYAAGSTRNPDDGGEIRFEAIRVIGHLPPAEVSGWMARAAIYALPARYEPFGLTALEAAHAGCALVLGDIPSLREIWQDTALFVSPNDHRETVKAVEALASDEKLRREMASRARRRAAEFTPERMLGGYLSLYERLMIRDAQRILDRRASRTPERYQRTGTIAR